MWGVEMTTNEMKALSKLHAREGLWMVQAPVPEIGPDDVLLEVANVGVDLAEDHGYWG